MKATSCLKMILLVWLASGEMVLAQEASPPTPMTPEQFDQKVSSKGACPGNEALQRTLIMDSEGRLRFQPVKAAESNEDSEAANIWQSQSELACANGVAKMVEEEKARIPHLYQRVLENVQKHIINLSGPKVYQIKRVSPVLGIRG